MALSYLLESAPRKWLPSPRGRRRFLLAAASIALLAIAIAAGTTPRRVPSPAPEAAVDRASVELPSLAPSPSRRTVAPSNVAPIETGIVNPVPARADTGLEAVLGTAAEQYQGSLSVVVRNLRTGATATLNAGERFRAASLYKLFVLYSAFDQMRRGELTWTERLTLSRVAADADPNVEWPAGTQMSVEDSLKAMIDVSNNAAADMLEERVGGDPRINDDMKALGLKQSVVGRDFAYTSAADMATLLEAIATGRALDEASSTQMLSLLKDQRRNDRLPLPLPLNVQVAHKTGELTHLRNEAGIVYSPSGPYLFVALADKASSDAAARQVILDLSRDVYAYFETGGLTHYLGLPPRVAEEVFQTFDSQGRMAALDDEWGETVPVASSGVRLVDGVKKAVLREVVVPGLMAMQLDAEDVGAPFWVTSGYIAPRAIDAPLVAKSAGALPIKVELPPKKPAPSSSPAPATPKPAQGPPMASQQWLGTVAGIADSPDGKPSQPTFDGSATGHWLLGHSWEYGFVLVPPESPQGNAIGYEPWTLRWVGRVMAERLHSLGYERNVRIVVTAELQKAEQELGDPSKWRDIEEEFLFDG